MITQKILYPHQNDSYIETTKNNKGIICIPTGTGKTLIQSFITAKSCFEKPGFKIYVINVPRIILSYQLLQEVYTYLLSYHIEARYMFVHSGGKTDMDDLDEIRIESNRGYNGEIIPYSKIENGTSSKKIREVILKTKKQNLPLILFSTYNSAGRIELARLNIPDDELNELEEYPVFEKPKKEDFGFKNKWLFEEDEDNYLDSLRKWERLEFYKNKIELSPELTIYDEIEIVMNDEAHYLVQERFFPILKILKTNRCYFFTATTKNTPSDKGRGMNNVDLYGPILYEMSPREAIKRGLMVRPRLHFLTSKKIYTTEDFDKSIGVIIQESFLQHAYILKTIQPKILVSVLGVDDIKRFKETKEYRTLIYGGTNIYCIASNKSIGNDINGDKVSRQEFLKRLKQDGKNREKRIIVLHYDILAEGIDVSGFTGMLPFRTLLKLKFLQTFGRVARLDYYDRERLENGELNPDDISEFMKPYAWIIIPTIIYENSDNKEHFYNLVRELRDYGFNPSEDIVVTNDTHGLKGVDGPEALNELKKNSKLIGNYIEEINSEYEDEEIANLIDEIHIDKNLLKKKGFYQNMVFDNKKIKKLNKNKNKNIWDGSENLNGVNYPVIIKSVNYKSNELAFGDPQKLSEITNDFLLYIGIKNNDLNTVKEYKILMKNEIWKNYFNNSTEIIKNLKKEIEYINTDIEWNHLMSKCRINNKKNDVFMMRLKRDKKKYKQKRVQCSLNIKHLLRDNKNNILL